MQRPGLLVSVRNSYEAMIAQRAGADLIDLKDPSNGPLGMCDPSVWEQVALRMGGKVPLSAALGEWHEWGRLSDAQASRRLLALNGFDFAKLGPQGSSRDEAAELRRTFGRLRGLGPQGLRWIAVVYADQGREITVTRNRILEIAVECGCAGVLIDTFDKSRPAFLHSGMTGFVRRVRDQGLFVALAGGLTAKSIRRTSCCEPDWFAVRGAACRNGKRDSEVSFRRIAALVRCIENLRNMR